MRENAEFSIKVIIVSNKHGATKNPETQRQVSLRPRVRSYPVGNRAETPTIKNNRHYRPPNP